MTAAFGGGGGYKMESPESRTLQSFSADKFSYRDQGKNIIELNNAVGYISGMMRKMQKGIDSANQNFIQQIESLIRGALVAIGGGGDTGLDFGDLKYILQAIGALFGFADEEGNITVPINLFNAAWHFFSQYIGISTNFSELINQIVDNLIATVLDLFGEVPIIGQALQQLAVIISEVRDLLNPIVEALQAFFDAFNIQLGDIDGIAGLFGPFAPIVDALLNALDGINLPDFSAVFRMIAQWTTPFVNAIVVVINVLTEVVELFTGQSDLGQLWEVFTKGLLSIFSPLNASNLFGTPPTSLFDQIPLASIFDFRANYAANPNFVNDSSVEGSNDWFWNPNLTYDVKVTDAGSVHTFGDGYNHDLYSNVVSVKPGQKIDFAIRCQWEDLAYTGDNPIELVVSYYQGEDEVITEVLEKLAPTTASTPNGAWVQLAEDFRVPRYDEDDFPYSVDGAAMVLRVTTSATAGTVNFSSADIAKGFVAGIAPLEWVKELPDLLGALDEFLQWIMDTIVEVVDGIPIVGTPLSNFLEKIFDWFEDTLFTAQEASDAKGGLSDLIDAFLRGWRKEDAPGGGWALAGLAEFFNLTFGKSRELSQIGAGLAQLQADQAANNNSGKSIVIDVSEYGAIPDGFTKFYDTGAVDTYNDGNSLQMPRGVGTELFIFDEPLLTNYAEISLIISRHSINYFGSHGDRSVYFIYRANHPTAPTEFTFAQLNGDDVRWGCVKPGYPFTAPFWFGTDQDLDNNLPSYITARFGVAADPRFFQLAANNQTINNEIDETDQSAFGETHRYWGWGIQNDNPDLIDRSFQISHFAANDNEPAPTLGTYCRVTRLNSGYATFSSGQKFPNDFYDTVERTSPNIVPVLNDRSGVKVLESGPYDVEIGVKKTTVGISENYEYDLTVYRGAALAGRGAGPMGIYNGDGNSNGSIDMRLRGLVLRRTIYCEANDIIYPGYEGATAGTSSRFEGGADGISSWMTVTKVGGSQ